MLGETAAQLSFYLAMAAKGDDLGLGNSTMRRAI
jgi:hypothetical protein